ncbi:hypothetical protein Dsin_017096 [Dipteronia sinensis]|uniref:DUF1985 domain-containing protein n=1 Tax=Dipteronia sinensis TaxID=43782 RepID=A0AAE0E6M1_9ROSI|nr:hypothetical protein Dsin_017096 [Dipteronia sinensis]
MGDTKVKLKLLIDTKCQRVELAKGGKDFFELIFKALSDIADHSLSLCSLCQRNIVNKMCNVSISSAKTNVRDEAGFGYGLATYLVMDDLEMPKNSNEKLWRFPGHEKWIPARVNNRSKMFMIRDLKVVLQKFGLLEKFKQVPFGRGLKMGQLPEGFANNNEVEEDSILRRIFKGKMCTAEVLYAALKKMSFEESEDAYKMLNIYMVSKFFSTDDGRTTVISGWLFSLVVNEDEFKKFPWGSYIFSFTLFFLKDVLNKRLPKLRGEEEKEDMKGKMKKNKKTVEEKVELEEEKEEDDKKKKKQEVSGRKRSERERQRERQRKATRWLYLIGMLKLLRKVQITSNPSTLNVCGPLIDKKREKLALPRSEEEEDLGSDDEGDDNQIDNDNDGIESSVQNDEI